MRSFKDAKGDQWDIEITLLEVEEVQQELGIYLTEAGADLQKFIKKLAKDSALCGKILWVVLREQAAPRNLTDRDFKRRIYGDAVFSAQEALIRSIIDFFLSQEDAKQVQNMLDVAVEDVMKQKAAASQELKELATDFQANTSIGSTLNTPAFADRTPTTSSMGS